MVFLTLYLDRITKRAFLYNYLPPRTLLFKWFKCQDPASVKLMINFSLGRPKLWVHTSGESFVCLGGAVCGDGKTEREVRRRAQAGANVWRAVEGVMADRRISKRPNG